jgi:hypothetical protein
MTTASHRSRGGFSAHDLVVLTAIAGLVVIWVLAALPTIRERRQRLNCMDNMRQLVLACHNADDTCASFPAYDPRVVPNASYFNAGGNYGSTYFAMSPYIGCFGLMGSGGYPGPSPPSRGYAVTVVKRSNQAPVNYVPGPPLHLVDYLENPPQPNMVLTLVINWFACSSDPTYQESGGVAPNGWGGSSYACNFLVFGNSAIEDVNDPDGLGGSGRKGAWGQKVTIRDSFPDGTTRTILFAEKYVSCNNGTTGSAWAWPNHDSSFAPAVAMESPWNDGTRFQWLPKPSQCVSQYAQTGHAAGMNVIMADGSGRTLSPSISALTYQHAMQPNDGEQLGSDW